jgi:hypothetical protein
MTAPAIKRRSLEPAGAAMQRAGCVCRGEAWLQFQPVSRNRILAGVRRTLRVHVRDHLYRLQIGTASMSAALLTLALEKKSLAAARRRCDVARARGMGVPRRIDDVDIRIPSSRTMRNSPRSAPSSSWRERHQHAARFRAFAVGSIIIWGMYPIRGTIFSFFLYHGDVQGRAAWNYIYANPNDLAGLCLLQLSMALGMLASREARVGALGMKFAVALLVLIIILTQSRGAVIALDGFG